MKRNIRLLFSVVAAELDVTPGELVSRSRLRHLVEAREVFARICREQFELSFPATGRHLHRDHTTIMSLLKKHRVDDEAYQRVLHSYQLLVNR